ncbi:putative low-affinity inorganic phosphate transporter [Cupriavidus necator H850]|jgi:PiT family inorganic phosphate transporter|uniref:inorganic phosphate transporter n=1 Tax=Cupriavidus TaxID=106589 RepID=UPI00129E4C44|nr:MULTISPECIES: inorganic phosphate transporter [Cupriavidus]KAI3600645.1 putative low-affinity inorganic phosphate transporter [Cupriavidus necator H850]QUN31866.1 inorganic phosphate transporter [Cupriavidus sp. KK10]
MQNTWVLLIVTMAMVLVFDFTNGFHDSSNMIATLVASRAMTPVQALLLVGVFTFLGPLLAGTAVADTIGGFVSLASVPEQLGIALVLCGIVAAVAWNLLTWWLAMPSSSSHALVGGLVGVVLVSTGPDNVVWGGAQLAEGKLTGVTKVLLSLLLSPLAGFAIGFVLHRLMKYLLRAAHPSVNRKLRHGQWWTAAVLAFSHGANDAQKGMGIITLVLVLGGILPAFTVPPWVILASATSITLGTLLGGWRIVRTVGYGIYKLRPLHGLNAQLASSAVIFGASLVGGPVSTTHVVSSSIMGLGASERPRAVHWMKAREIALTWVVTLPGAALLGAALTWLLITFTYLH